MRWTARMAMTVALAGALGVPVATRGETPEEVDRVVAKLGSEDPQERREALERIGKLGTEAREALSRAAESPDPAVARAAQSLLGTLPWYTPADPPDVRQHLETYAAAGPDERHQIISHLSQLRFPAAGTALARILVEEPNATLRWQVVTTAIERPELIKPQALRELAPKSPAAPVLTAQAWAWRETDRAKAETLLRQALELEAARPTDDNNALLRPWRWLYQTTLGRQRTEEAAELCRLAAARHAALRPGEDSWAVRELFTLHARFGPLPTFDADLRRFGPRVSSAVDLYLVAECLRKAGASVLARPLDRVGMLQGANAPALRLQTAWALMQLSWVELAERELEMMLREPSLEEGVPTPLNEAYVASALTSLAYLAGIAGRDAEAAERWERAIPALRQFRDARLPGQAVDGDATVHAREQMLWRSMRAARDRGDQAEMDRLVDQLAQYGTADADILHDLLPALRARGRDDDARRLFDAAYAVVKVGLEQLPEEAEPMNNLAWLCARAGERLDEALKLAGRAVELEPDNAAYLDTLAEAYYRTGRPARAVELESRALQLRPGDRFMQGQLARYRAAAATQPAQEQ